MINIIMAATVFFPRVRETSLSVGTGNLEFNGVPAGQGFRTFSAAGVVNNDRIYYSAHQGGLNFYEGEYWEVGLGTYKTAATPYLQRDTIFASSNSGNAVSFPSGEKLIIMRESAFACNRFSASRTYSGTTYSFACLDDTDPGDGWAAGRFSDGTRSVVLCDGTNALTVTGGTISATNTFVRDIVFALAMGTTAVVTSPGNTVAGSPANAVILTYAGTIVKAKAFAKTAPSGGSGLTFDLNLSDSNGANTATIWSTQGNRLNIASGSNNAQTSTFNTTTFTENQILTIDVDTVGSTTPGQDITVVLTVRYSV